jgi:hypothetical protein
VTDSTVEEVKDDEYDDFDPDAPGEEDIAEDEGHELDEEPVGDLPEGDDDAQPA